MCENNLETGGARRQSIAPGNRFSGAITNDDDLAPGAAFIIAPIPTYIWSNRQKRWAGERTDVRVQIFSTCLFCASRSGINRRHAAVLCTNPAEALFVAARAKWKQKQALAHLVLINYRSVREHLFRSFSLSDSSFRGGLKSACRRAGGAFG